MPDKILRTLALQPLRYMSFHYVIKPCYNGTQSFMPPTGSYVRADSKLAPSQWKTSLQRNAVSHWLSANLEPALTCRHSSPNCTEVSSVHKVHVERQTDTSHNSIHIARNLNVYKFVAMFLFNYVYSHVKLIIHILCFITHYFTCWFWLRGCAVFCCSWSLFLNFTRLVRNDKIKMFNKKSTSAGQPCM